MVWRCWTKGGMPQPGESLPGRSMPLHVPGPHYVTGRSLLPPYPDRAEQALFGMGCFWGAERLFWVRSGVHVTAVGYSGGWTPNPSYQEVCSGRTGHAEVVFVVFLPDQISYESLLRTFWESHDPTQGMRQGNDVGTQYRSVIYTFSEQQQATADRSRDVYQTALRDKGFGTVTTEISAASAFYFAEDYHQQYLAKNPGGYCGLGGTGVSCPISAG